MKQGPNRLRLRRVVSVGGNDVKSPGSVYLCVNAMLHALYTLLTFYVCTSCSVPRLDEKRKMILYQCREIVDRISVVKG